MRPTRDGGRAVWAIGLFLSACSAPPTANEAAPHGSNVVLNNAVSDLDALAAESGVISENQTVDPSGSYGRSYEGGDDRLCLTLAGDAYRAAVEIRIGEEEYCRGEGTARRTANGLILSLAHDRCTIAARDEGDRLVLPGAVEAACASLCSARGSLAGVTFPRIASGDPVARRVIASDGKPLCGG